MKQTYILCEPRSFTLKVGRRTVAPPGTRRSIIFMQASDLMLIFEDQTAVYRQGQATPTGEAVLLIKVSTCNEEIMGSG